MPSPRVFKTRNELFTALRKNRKCARCFFNRRSDSLEELVSSSVGQNTFRAFHLKSHKITHIGPQELYRTWAVAWFNRNRTRLQNIRTRQAMERLIHDAAASLIRYWARKTKRRHKIDFGSAAKLVNLTMKFILRLDKFTAEDQERVRAFLDVPLDSYTLQGIRLLCSDLKIPSNATMGFVQTKKRYQNIQNAIRTLLASKFYPIEYEIAAWNSSHA